MAVYMNDIQKLVELFEILADGNRLRIIKFIAEKSYSVNEISEGLSLSQPLVSHHLRILRDRGILLAERKGPFIYHRLKDTKLLDALGIFTDISENLTGISFKEKSFSCPFWFKNFRK